MNSCSSSIVVSSFGLRNGVFGGSGGQGTEIGVTILMGGVDVSFSFLRNLILSMFLEIGIHPYMHIGMVYKDVLGDICL